MKYWHVPSSCVNEHWFGVGVLAFTNLPHLPSESYWAAQDQKVSFILYACKYFGRVNWCIDRFHFPGTWPTVMWNSWYHFPRLYQWMVCFCHIGQNTAPLAAEPLVTAGMAFPHLQGKRQEAEWCPQLPPQLQVGRGRPTPLSSFLLLPHAIPPSHSVCSESSAGCCWGPGRIFFTLLAIGLWEGCFSPTLPCGSVYFSVMEVGEW